MKQRGKKKKRIKRNKNNLRDLWDNVKCPNIRIIGVPEEEDKKKGHEQIFEEIIVENCPKMGKEVATQVQETQRVSFAFWHAMTQFNAGGIWTLFIPGIGEGELYKYCITTTDGSKKYRVPNRINPR